MKKILLISGIVLGLLNFLNAQEWKTQFLPGGMDIKSMKKVDTSIWAYANNSTLVRLNTEGEVQERNSVGSWVDMKVSPSGIPYFIDYKGLYKWESDTLQSVELHRDFSGVSLKNMVIGSSDYKYLIEDDTLFVEREGSWHEYSLVDMLTHLCNSGRVGYPCSWQIEEGKTVVYKNYVFGLIKYGVSLTKVWYLDLNTGDHHTYDDFHFEGKFLNYNDELYLYESSRLIRIDLNSDTLDSQMEVRGRDLFVVNENTFVAYNIENDSILLNDSEYEYVLNYSYSSFQLDDGKVPDQSTWKEEISTFRAVEDLLAVNDSSFICSYKYGPRAYYFQNGKMRNMVRFVSEPACFQGLMDTLITQSGSEDPKLTLWKDGNGEIWWNSNFHLIHSDDDCLRKKVEVQGNFYFYPEPVSDESGNLWQFDGPSSYGFSTSDIQSFPSQFVNYLKLYDGVEWQEIDNTDHPMILYEDLISLDQNNHVWFSYFKYELIGDDETNRLDNYIGYYKDNEWHFLEDESHKPTAFLKDEHQHLHMLEGNSVFSLSGEKPVEEFHFNNDTIDVISGAFEASGQFTALAQSTDDHYLLSYNGQEWSVLLLPDSMQYFEIKADKINGVWVRTDKGVGYKAYSDEFKWYNTLDGLPDSRPADLEIASDGEVWLSYDDHVASIYPEHLVASFSEDISETSSVSFYPNPVDEMIYLLEENIDYVEVVSLQGVSVLQTSDKELNVADLAPGVYCLIVKYRSRQKTSMFVKR